MVIHDTVAANVLANVSVACCRYAATANFLAGVTAVRRKDSAMVEFQTIFY